jgi:hypothetical protein
MQPKRAAAQYEQDETTKDKKKKTQRFLDSLDTPSAVELGRVPRTQAGTWAFNAR